MKEVGLKLKEKRKNLKMSYEEVSNLTRLPIGTIKAIEAGDLDHFQDDLTYVRFYVRSYCKVIDVPYENFKDDVLGSVDEYTTTMSMNALKEREELEQHIAKKKSAPVKKVDTSNEKGPQLAKKDRTSISQNAKNIRFRKAKKIDFAFLSLIVVIAAVVIIVIYVAFTSLLDNDEKTLPADDKVSDVDKNTPTPEEDQDVDDKDTDKEDDKDNPKTDSKVAFEQIAVNHYSLSGIKANEAIKLEITFSNAGSFNLWKGNTPFAGAYGVYEAGATYTYDSTVIANELITLNFWSFGGAEIKINGEKLEYDASKLIPQDGVTYFQITTKGE